MMERKSVKIAASAAALILLTIQTVYIAQIDLSEKNLNITIVVKDQSHDSKTFHSVIHVIKCPPTRVTKFPTQTCNATEFLGNVQLNETSQKVGKNVTSEKPNDGDIFLGWF